MAPLIPLNISIGKLQSATLTLANVPHTEHSPEKRLELDRSQNHARQLPQRTIPTDTDYANVPRLWGIRKARILVGKICQTFSGRVNSLGEKRIPARVSIRPRFKPRPARYLRN